VIAQEKPRLRSGPLLRELPSQQETALAAFGLATTILTVAGRLIADRATMESQLAAYPRKS